MPRILLATPEGHQVVELREHNTLGRHPSNTIQLLDKIVSKEHCTIEKRGDRFVLRDLGSLNGTYINGERVSGEQLLKHGDDIALGTTRARFDDGSGLPLSPPPSIGAPLAAAAPPGWQASSVAPRPPMQSQPDAPLATGSAQATRPMPVSMGPLGTAAIPTYGVGQAAGMGFEPAPPSPPGGSLPPLNATRVDVSDKSRAIGTQIAATQKGFLPFDQVRGNAQQLMADYERLRLSHELSREIALERDLPTLLNKILLTIFKFVRADRGVIFLMDNTQLVPGASLRRDGTETPISVSSTIMNHVIKERATVLTHDAAMDFAASKGKSMILNRISSAIVAPLLHNDDILGVLWLDSETLAQFQPKDMEIVTAIAAQAAMFI